MFLLELEGVSRSFGAVQALSPVELEVDRGEWVCLMGPSGSGKSTLLNIIGCMDRPTGGRMWLDGVEVSVFKEKELNKIRREKIGLVFQQFHMIPYLSALENVMLAQYYHSVADEKEALEALQRVGLGHRAQHLPRQLSGGEQQRVCIARALINYPALILADEPTGNLDEDNEHLVLELFQQLHREGHTIVMVTHDLEVAGLAQRLVVLEHGRIVEERRNSPALSHECHGDSRLYENKS